MKNKEFKFFMMRRRTYSRLAMYGMLSSAMLLHAPWQGEAFAAADNAMPQSVSQANSVTGTVVDETGEPMIGV